jgi:hypothetical protein
MSSNNNTQEMLAIWNHLRASVFDSTTSDSGLPTFESLQKDVAFIHGLQEFSSADLASLVNLTIYTYSKTIISFWQKVVRDILIRGGDDPAEADELFRQRVLSLNALPGLPAIQEALIEVFKSLAKVEALHAQAPDTAEEVAP